MHRRCPGKGEIGKREERRRQANDVKPKHGKPGPRMGNGRPGQGAEIVATPRSSVAGRGRRLGELPKRFIIKLNMILRPA